MATGDDGGQGVVQASAAREQVADGVNADCASSGTRLGNEEIAALAVELGECEAADAALGCRADRGQTHQRIPETLPVDAQ